MFGRHISALALLLSCASAPLHANVSSFNGDCWQGSELDALKVQRFKTMLLVSMLNCRDQEPGIGEDYNRFIRANRDLIAQNQSVVRQHFIRTHGPSGGLTAYTDYETALGNQFSNADYSPDRCADAAAELREAGYVSERGLMDMIQSVPDENDVAICGAEPRYAERRAEFAPPPPVVQPAPVPPQMQVETQGPDDESSDLAAIEPEGPARAIDPNQGRLTEAAPPPPVAMPEKANEPAPAPVQLAVADVPKPVVAAPQAPDRVKAVRDAAKALREALAALETEEGEGVK
ncbi:hypothetical protein ACFSCW_16380 [Sphingomonas tabacisoli]|uniref:Uncharacterized protein n=1 Tax=Sphingomonas tabacisoli TaxID=2249466 RepID=A0ABW4I648_9SPHN